MFLDKEMISLHDRAVRGRDWRSFPLTIDRYISIDKQIYTLNNQPVCEPAWATRIGDVLGLLESMRRNICLPATKKNFLDH